MIIIVTANGLAQLGRRCLGIAFGWVASGAAAVRQRRTYVALSALDDRALHDIGLDRSMVMSAVVSGRPLRRA